MFGFNPSPVTVISLLRINGIMLIPTVLVFLSSVNSSTTEVLIPDLVCVSGVSVIVLVVLDPGTQVPPCPGVPSHAPARLETVSVPVLLGCPTHDVCQLFHTVPSEFPTPANTVSKFPSLLTLISGKV